MSNGTQDFGGYRAVVKFKLDTDGRYKRGPLWIEGEEEMGWRVWFVDGVNFDIHLCEYGTLERALEYGESALWWI